MLSYFAMRCISEDGRLDFSLDFLKILYYYAYNKT